MGICASCLKGRDKKQAGPHAETQPLLANDNDVDNDLASDNADELSVRRHEELDRIVHATLDYFIDMSSVSNAENGEPLDVSALSKQLADRQQDVELAIPSVADLQPEERETLEKDLQELGPELGLKQ